MRCINLLTRVVTIMACCISQLVLAQNVESLVMPGPVIEGHIEAEAECSSCHRRFSRSEQNKLCIACHEDVGADIANALGFHGKFAEAGGSRCSSCHTDHEGRNAEIVILDEATFDHLFTDFTLLGKHADVACDDCHQEEDKHRNAPQGCNSCHRDDDIHNGNLGTECADCHNESDWLEIDFDHDTTDYPLIGKHRETVCRNCHEIETLKNTPTTCFGCHAEDDAHDGRSGNRCETCHNPTSWTDSTFDHSRDTGFDLLGSHGSLACDDCHSADPFADQLGIECVDCHLEGDNHAGHNGTDCGGCHTNSEWPDIQFVHDTDTEFELHGSHRTVACNDCHVEPIFATTLETNCVSCHRDDEPHDGKQGDRCNDCHSEESWQEAPFFAHDLTRFPLLGEHDNLECESCHETRVFAGTNNACMDCHREDDPHDGRFMDSCGDCHNPVAWDLWLFDHNARTDFILNGAHVDVVCDDCHRSSLASMQNSANSCADCHRADDVHDGEFGSDCGRCHTENSFTEVRSLQ